MFDYSLFLASFGEFIAQKVNKFSNLLYGFAVEEKNVILSKALTSSDNSVFKIKSVHVTT